MSIRGHVQIKEPEYGHCHLSSWIADQCVMIMMENDVTVYVHNGDFEQWEIEVNACLEEFVERLENNPDILDEYLSGDLKGSGRGKELLSILKEGLEAAEKENMSYIMIDWY